MNKTKHILKAVEKHPGLMAGEYHKLINKKSIPRAYVQIVLTAAWKKGLLVREQPDNLYYRYRIKL